MRIYYKNRSAHFALQPIVMDNSYHPAVCCSLGSVASCLLCKVSLFTQEAPFLCTWTAKKMEWVDKSLKIPKG